MTPLKRHWGRRRVGAGHDMPKAVRRLYAIRLMAMRAGHTVAVEKDVRRRRLSPVAPKKIGEIVGSAAPVAADGTSGDDANAIGKI